jgi:site-specific DNA-methyltransferase (adenine-specific)
MIHHGDCLDVMAAMEPESVDAIVTDPPYGLEFMGKEWDKLGRDGPASFENLGTAKGLPPERRATRGDGGSTTSTRYRDKPRFSTLTGDSMRAAQEWHARWAEAAYRVAKPSAYLLAFGGTRTVHRMTVALEDAGWIIRDMLVWAYASGFPKSKASLKPAWEPIVMARKPGPLRDLAIDACRIGTLDDTQETWNAKGSGGKPGANGHAGQFSQAQKDAYARGDIPLPSGRWPANVILTDPIFDGGVEGVVGGGETHSQDPATRANVRHASFFGAVAEMDNPGGYGDGGTYSRFFLIPKADRADREPVLGGLPLRKAEREYGDTFSQGRNPVTGERTGNVIGPRQNVHPTVKPTDLMRHLVRLVTPVGGTVLDPFLGSGSTGLACELEGFPWVGIEREAEYVAIAEARLNGTQRGLGLAI